MKRLRIYSILCIFASVLASGSALWGQESPVSLKSGRKPGQTDRVEVRLEIGGETLFTEKDKTEREKMSVKCDLDYVEKTLDVASGEDGVSRSMRDYENVAIEVKVGDGQFKPALKPEHRRIAVDASPKAETLFSPDGNVTRDELDAIDVPVSSLLLDRLLPDRPVSVGDQWAYADDFLAALLGLDEVAQSTVQSTLKEVTKDYARFEIAGRVEGALLGMSTVIDLKGRYRFHLDSRRVDWVGMLIKEVRKDSFVADGVDAVSRLSIKVTPCKEPDNLTEDALASLATKPTPELVALRFESGGGEWQFLYDRRWQIHQQRPKVDAAILRFVDRGDWAGQCNLSSLPQRKPEELVALEQFQDDVKKALGESFGEFIEAAETSNDANARIYRVVVEGVSAEIPMRWIYYLVADPKGRQVALTFAVEQKLAEQFAESDRPIIESLRFSEP